MKIQKYRRTWHSWVDARVELEKQYIKYPFKFYLSKGWNKQTKKKTKHLLFSVESWRQRTASGSQWNELIQKDRLWASASSSWRQGARIALFFSCLCSCSLTGRSEENELESWGKKRKPIKNHEAAFPKNYLLDSCFKAFTVFLDSCSDISLAFPAHSLLIFFYCYMPVMSAGFIF